MTHRLALCTAALLMAAAVALGAFGAHALKSRAGPEALTIWQTAVDYHAWHALSLLAVGTLMLHSRRSDALRYAAWLFIAGILLFSGSLYAMALGAPRAFALATPVGGTAFIAGWIALALGVARSRAPGDPPP